MADKHGGTNIRKVFTEKRLALAISRLIDTVEGRAKRGHLTTEDTLKALHAMGMIVPAYTKLLENVGMAKRLEEVEEILKQRQETLKQRES